MPPGHQTMPVTHCISGPSRSRWCAARGRQAGRVVNISSQVGSFEVVQRIGRDVSYTASKAALNMVSLKLAQVFQPDDVIVVAMHPGYLRTDMGGPGADLDPDEAVGQIVATVDSLTLDCSGAFIRWDGTTHPW